MPVEEMIIQTAKLISRVGGGKETRKREHKKSIENLGSRR